MQPFAFSASLNPPGVPLFVIEHYPGGSTLVDEPGLVNHGFTVRRVQIKDNRFGTKLNDKGQSWPSLWIAVRNRE